jgi:hypothetical protein
MEKIDFKYFLEKFPTQALPVTLRADTFEELTAGIDPLPSLLIEQYLMDEEEEEDGMTEYLACFSLPTHEGYEAIVYWKASLLNYEYVLKTYTKDGFAVIDSKTIAGTAVVENQLIESIATIQEDRIIYIATGASDAHTMEFDTASNKIRHFEIVDDGTIIES